MKKIKKLQFATLFVGVSALVAGFAFMNADTQVQADATGKFSMEKGAVIRTNPDEAGMRWITSVTESWYNVKVPAGAKVVFGTFVTSADNVESVEDLDENFTNGKKDIVCADKANFKDGAFTYYSSVLYNNVSTENEKSAYAEELVARSYVKYSTNDGATWTYEYADVEDSTRCIRVVAATTIIDDETYVDFSNDEKTAVESFVGEKNGDLVGDGYLETAENDTFDASSYVTVYENYKRTNNAKTEFTIGEHYNYLYFDANENFATARFQYVTKAVDDEVEFSKVFRSSTETAIEEGYYALGQDITLAGTWTNATTFKATLDGNGYTINGLELGKNSGIFKSVDGATIKNVCVKDATIAGCDTGVFAYQTKGTVTFDNVYVSIAGTSFSEYYTTEEQNANPVFVLDSRYGIGGLIGKSTKAVTVKNSVIYVPEHLTKASGFVAGQATSGTINITNSTFIGGNGKIYGEILDNVATVVKDDKTVICDAVTAYKALYGDDFDATEKENANGWSNTVMEAYEINHPLMVLNASNVTDLSNATSEIAVLTENLDLNDTAVTYFGGNNSFTGVFDGQNHWIVGIDANTKESGGLFKTLAGSVKNVALDGKCTNSKGGNGGLITDNIVGNTYLENVYLKPTFQYSAGGAVCRRIGTNEESHVSLSMKDVVVIVEKFSETEKWIDVNGAVFACGVRFGYGSTSSMGVYMENCYCIAPEDRPVGWRASVAKADPLSSLEGNDKYFFWNVGDTVGGTTMTQDDGFTWYAPDRLQLFNARVQTGGIKLSDFLKERIGELTTKQ